jgi:hypothetical protein
MRDVQSIMAEYRDSDLSKRMVLFLEFRELREEFSEIDKKEGFVGVCGETDTPSYLSGEIGVIADFMIRPLTLWALGLKGALKGSTPESNGFL